MMDNTKRISLTQAAYDKYKNEYDYLTKTARAEIAVKIGEAKSYGDLSENSEYDAAREEQGRIESRIAEIEAILKNHVIIDESSIRTDEVNMGSYVKVFDVDFNEEAVYQIVGSAEADPIAGKISNESPVGKALIGSKVGAEVKVEAPGGIVKLVVREISNAEFK